MDNVTVTLVGGPTLLIEIAGYRMITDPTFDPPQVYHHPIAGPVTKKLGPSATPEQLGQVDLALVSHEHIDNLDVAGRGFLTMIPLALTTAEAAEGFGANVVGMKDYDTRTVELPDGRRMKITAVPAHHGPEGVWDALGPVIGFVLEAEGMPTIYVSGDNSELDIVREIADLFPDIDQIRCHCRWRVHHAQQRTGSRGSQNPGCEQDRPGTRRFLGTLQPERG